MFKTALFAAAAVVTTAATAVPVLAKDVPVTYHDLDLSTAKGQNTLALRIKRAARKACDFASEGRIPSRGALKCYRQAHAKAQTQMAALIGDNRLGG